MGKYFVETKQIKLFSYLEKLKTIVCDDAMIIHNNFNEFY